MTDGTTGDGSAAEEVARQRLHEDRARLGSLVGWACGNGLHLGNCRLVGEERMEANLRRIARAANLRSQLRDLLDEDHVQGEGISVEITVDLG